MGFPVITFESNGGSAVPQIEQTAYDVPAAKPADPTKANNTFDGWFYEPEFTNPVDWESGVNRSMTLYAKWTPVSAPVTTYTVTFDSNGGSSVPSQTVQSGSTATVPVKPTKAGFVFSEWKLNGQPYDFASSVTSNITLVASWTENVQPVITHHIIFDVDGGSSAVAARTVNNGSSFTLPSYDGSKQGFTFGGWTYSNLTYQPGNTVVVSSDMTFKALWISDTPTPVDQNVTITFNVDGGSISVSAQTVKTGTSVTLPSYNGVKEGHRFGGWAIGMLTYQPGSSVTLSGDVTAKAIWIQDSADEPEQQDFGTFLKDFVTEPFGVAVLIMLVLGLIVLAMTIRSRRF